MPTKFLISCLCFFLAIPVFATTSFARRPHCEAYGWDYKTVNYAIDLEYMKDDALHVDMSIEDVRKNNVIFCMPKIVPGIYGAMDFGQFIDHISASDQQGNQLEIEQLDVNRWKIKHAKGRLLTIHYDVNDDWEEFNETHPEGYLSASSMFRQGDVFVLNHNALFGYVEGFQDLGIQLEINKPASMTGTTSLYKTVKSETQDLYAADNYRALVDQPILYGKFEISTFQLGDVTVNVAMYSTTGKSLAPEIATSIRPLMEHQQAYLGGKLPVSNYTFLLYHNESPEKGSYRWDGLEHSTSTLILMFTAFDPEMIRKNVYGVASHEFFHTIVPLGIHSEEIGEYDFNDPKMSRHLWMYEGLTEYFTIHMPVKEHLITLDEFMKSLQEKIDESWSFSHEHSLSFLSRNVMDHQDQYMDFYRTGALLNMCLDIRLRELSDGYAYGVQLMTADLMDEYGPYRSFKDKKLFREIGYISGHSEITKFLKTYVENGKELPLKEYFAKVGIDYNEETHQISLMANPTAVQLALRNAWLGQ